MRLRWNLIRQRAGLLFIRRVFSAETHHPGVHISTWGNLSLTGTSKVHAHPQPPVTCRYLHPHPHCDFLVLTKAVNREDEEWKREKTWKSEPDVKQDQMHKAAKSVSVDFLHPVLREILDMRRYLTLGRPSKIIIWSKLWWITVWKTGCLWGSSFNNDLSLRISPLKGLLLHHSFKPTLYLALRAEQAQFSQLKPVLFSILPVNTT